MPIAQGQVGPQQNYDGASPVQGFRQGHQGDLIVSELHGKYYEQTVRGNVYTFGISNTALAAANAIVTGVTATAQPVIGVWNPPSSGVNLSIIKASIVTTTVANSAVSPGGFMWMANANQNAITTGSTPYNGFTLLQAGSATKAFAVSTALTGMTGSLSTVRGCPIATTNAAGAATAAHLSVTPTEEYLDGLFIVPPGCVLALMNQVSTTTISVTAAITWEEIHT